MSKRSVVEFFEKVAVDKSIQKKIKEVDKISVTAFNDAVNEIAKIAKEEGFDFSAEDFIEARKETSSVVDEADETKPKGLVTEPGCLAVWGCGHNHPMWTLEDPKPCGQGVAYIPHSHH